MSSETETVSFGAWRLDLRAGRLFVHGKPASIPRGVRDLLLYLVMREGEVITKSDLVHEVWGGRDVSDAAIYNRVRALRLAIADEDGPLRCIQWEYGQGLRFERPLADLPGKGTAGKHPASLDATPRQTVSSGRNAAAQRPMRQAASVASLRPLLGTYHVFYRTPSWPKMVYCGVSILSEEGSRIIVRSIEHAKDSVIGVRQRERFRGEAQLIDGRLYVTEQSAKPPRALCLSALDAPHVFRLGIMTGIMLGSSWRLGGAPYATRVVWRSLPDGFSVRDAIRQSGPKLDEDSEVDPAIRESLGLDCLAFQEVLELF